MDKTDSDNNMNLPHDNEKPDNAEEMKTSNDSERRMYSGNIEKPVVLNNTEESEIPVDTEKSLNPDNTEKKINSYKNEKAIYETESEALNKEPLDNVNKKEIIFISRIKKAINTIPIKKIKSVLINMNIFRKIRESFVAFYLSRTVSAKKEDLTISWQPLSLIFIKIAIVTIISIFFYNLHPYVGGWLKNGLDFFKLDEIYNFKFPSRSFFDTIASYLFLFVIGYHGIYFMYHQIQALFSVLVINKSEKKVYYIKSFFIKKDLFIFSIPDIALVILKQNLISRFLGLGTISLQKRSGEQVVIRTIQRAHKLLKVMTEIKNANRENRLSDE